MAVILGAKHAVVLDAKRDTTVGGEHGVDVFAGQVVVHDGGPVAAELDRELLGVFGLFLTQGIVEGEDWSVDARKRRTTGELFEAHRVCSQPWYISQLGS